jgi:hypothetical protein
MPVQQFTEARQRLRYEWFDLVETQDDWTDLGPIGHGESCPIRVENKRTGRRGAAKPGAPKAAEDFCRAAHEKLAYDLAYLLELPVQPVGSGLTTRRLSTNVVELSALGSSINPPLGRWRRRGGVYRRRKSRALRRFFQR